MITQITDHVIAAQNRLIQQYKDSTNLKDLIEDLFGTQVQEIEDVFWDLLSRLDINTMVGQQLNNIGTLPGQARNGQTDAIYRLFIQAKIGVNVSESEASRIIDVWKLITQANLVHMFEAFPAEVDLYADVALDPALADLAFALIQDVVGAGIAVGFVGVINNVDDFGFEGSANSLGFGSALSQGTNTSTSANKLIDSGATFQTDLVDNTMVIYNTDESTVANIVSVDSEIQLTLDADIFGSSPKDYYVNENVGGKLSYIQAPLYRGELTPNSSLWGAVSSGWHFNSNNKDFKDNNHGIRFGAGTPFDTVNQKLGSAAALFNGINDRVDFGLLILVSGAVSVSGWIRGNLQGDTSIIDKSNFGAASDGFLVFISASGKLKIQAFGLASVESPVDVLDDKPHFFLAVFGDGVSSKLYVDNEAVVESPDTGNYTDGATTCMIGANSAGTGNFFNGLIDEVAIYNRALTATEKTKLYDEQT